MSYFLPNLDLISVGLVSAATAIMGFVIFFSNICLGFIGY